MKGIELNINGVHIVFVHISGGSMKKTVSIKENRMFSRLYRQGKSYVTPLFVVYVKKNRLNCNRLGITATKKIGNAVERNRAKRVIKEAYRLLEPELRTGMDIVIVARRKTVFVKTQAIMAALGALGL